MGSGQTFTPLKRRNLLRIQQLEGTEASGSELNSHPIRISNMRNEPQ